MTIEELVKGLQQALGPALKSVVLYGSAAAGDFVPGVSGHDILIVAERFGLIELTALSALLARWQQAGNPLPQLFTPEELASSIDVFPIELTDMRQSRRVLFGFDPLAEVKIDMQLFRLQLERDLKTRLLVLRQKYLACRGEPSCVARLMAESVSTFLVLFRAASRLYDEPVPAEKVAALAALRVHVKFDAEHFYAVLELKQRQRQPTPGEIETLFGNYLTSIEKVLQAVDQHLHAAPP